MLGAANPPADERTETVLSLMDQLAVKAHRKDRNRQVAMAYDAGIGEGYIGFSESMRLLQNRGDRTEIRTISFSDRENVFRLYTDATAVTAGVHGRRLEKCLELMNVMAEGDILRKLSVRDGQPQYLLRKLSVRDGQPQYLLLSRKQPYQALKERFPLYAQWRRTKKTM